MLSPNDGALSGEAEETGGEDRGDLGAAVDSRVVRFRGDGIGLRLPRGSVTRCHARRSTCISSFLEFGFLRLLSRFPKISYKTLVTRDTA